MRPSSSKHGKNFVSTEKNSSKDQILTYQMNVNETRTIMIYELCNIVYCKMKHNFDIIPSESFHSQFIMSAILFY